MPTLSKHHVKYSHGKRRVVGVFVMNLCFFREREDRQAIRKEDFILDKLKDQTIYRLPGSVNGQQFIGNIKNIDFLHFLFILFFLVQNCDVSQWKYYTSENFIFC